MSYPTLRLHPRKEESVLRFHPWIFSGAIASYSTPVQDGDLVSVVDSKGRPLGTGHFGGGSIAVRLLSFDPEEAIDRAFYKRRFEAALRLRLSCDLVRPVGSCERPNTTYRLVHGEGDSLPGLIIDIYDRTAVVQAHSLGMHQARQTIAEVLWEVYAEAGDPVEPLQGIYYKSETTLPTRDMRELASDGFLIGHTEAAPIYEMVCASLQTGSRDRRRASSLTSVTIVSWSVIMLRIVPCSMPSAIRGASPSMLCKLGQSVSILLIVRPRRCTLPSSTWL